MAKDRYVYPAIFTYAADGISIEFPNLTGCLPCARTTEDAMKNAREAMALHLYGMEQDHDPIPEPTPIDRLRTDHHQAIVLVEVWMPPFRDAIEQRAVKKTLSIPKWLDDIAVDHNVNFSHLLQKALKEYLGVEDRP